MARNDHDPPALRRRRRSWSLEEKRRIVDESVEDGASIAEVARRHDLNTNQLFTWRRQFGVDLAAPQDLAPILPVTITPDTAAADSDARLHHMPVVRQAAVASSFGLRFGGQGYFLTDARTHRGTSGESRPRKFGQ
jgi:transposase-like protein